MRAKIGLLLLAFLIPPLLAQERFLRIPPPQPQDGYKIAVTESSNAKDTSLNDFTVKLNLRIGLSTIGLETEGHIWPAKLQNLPPDRSRYKDLLGSHRVIASAMFKTDKKSFGVFLCKDASGYYLLVDSYGELNKRDFKRYRPRAGKDGSPQFNKVEFKIEEKRATTESDYRIYQKVIYREKDKSFSVATDWCREGKFTLENVPYPLILVKSAPGYLFRLEHGTDNLIIDLNHDGTFDWLEEAKPIRAPFRVKNHLYRASAIDTLGRFISFAYVGVDSSPTFSVGERFPSMELQDLNGNTYTTIGHDGHVTLLYFGATWCTPCSVVVADLKKLYRSYESRGLKIIGVSLDRDLNELNNYLKREKLPWPMAMRENPINEMVIKMFSVSYIPKLIVIDARGVIQYNGLSPRGKKLQQLVIEMLPSERQLGD